MPFYADVAAAQADGVLHHWPFDELPANYATFEDVVDGFNGALFIPAENTNDISQTVVNTPLGRGRDSGNHTIDGINTIGYQLKPGDYGYSAATELTQWAVRMRFYFRSVPTNYDTRLLNFGSKVYPGGKGFRMGILQSSGFFWAGTFDVYVEDTAALTANAWYEVIASYDGTKLSVYKNGALVGEDTAAATFKPYDTSPCFITGLHESAAQNEYQYLLDGIIDETTIWNRALTSQEVTNLYNSGTPVALIAEQIPPAVPVSEVREVATYKAILTGAPDSLADIELKISSFNARIRSARNSFLSVVVPHCSAQVDDIEARPNGELVVYQTLAGVDTEIARVNFQDLRLDKGPLAGTTATLSGYKQKTYDSPASYSVTTESYYSKNGGKSRFRSQLLKDIKPADSVTVQGVTFTVDTVALIGTQNRVYMEVSE